MKIIINKTGNVEEVSEKIASRLINKGKAHFPEEIPFNDFKPNKEEQKVIKEYSKKQGWPIKISKPAEEVVEIDLIEPIPERFTDFEEFKKPKKRSKKSKFKSWND